MISNATRQEPQQPRPTSHQPALGSNHLAPGSFLQNLLDNLTGANSNLTIGPVKAKLPSVPSIPTKSTSIYARRPLLYGRHHNPTHSKAIFPTNSSSSFSAARPHAPTKHSSPLSLTTSKSTNTGRMLSHAEEQDAMQEARLAKVKRNEGAALHDELMQQRKPGGGGAQAGMMRQRGTARMTTSVSASTSRAFGGPKASSMRTVMSARGRGRDAFPLRGGDAGNRAQRENWKDNLEKVYLSPRVSLKRKGEPLSASSASSSSASSAAEEQDSDSPMDVVSSDNDSLFGGSRGGADKQRARKTTAFKRPGRTTVNRAVKSGVPAKKSAARKIKLMPVSSESSSSQESSSGEEEEDELDGDEEGNVSSSSSEPTEPGPRTRSPSTAPIANMNVNVTVHANANANASVDDDLASMYGDEASPRLQVKVESLDDARAEYLLNPDRPFRRALPTSTPSKPSEVILVPDDTPPLVTIALPQLAPPAPIEAPEALVEALERLVGANVRMHRARGLPFLVRNVRRNFLGRCEEVGVGVAKDSVDWARPEKAHREHGHSDAANDSRGGDEEGAIGGEAAQGGDGGKGNEEEGAEGDEMDEVRVKFQYGVGVRHEVVMRERGGWRCPLCSLLGRLPNRKVLEKHLVWDHAEVFCEWRAVGYRSWALDILIPEEIPQSVPSRPGSVIGIEDEQEAAGTPTTTTRASTPRAALQHLGQEPEQQELQSSGAVSRGHTEMSMDIDDLPELRFADSRERVFPFAGTRSESSLPPPPTPTTVSRSSTPTLSASVTMGSATASSEESSAGTPVPYSQSLFTQRDPYAHAQPKPKPRPKLDSDGRLATMRAKGKQPVRYSTATSEAQSSSIRSQSTATTTTTTATATATPQRMLTPYDPSSHFIGPDNAPYPLPPPPGCDPLGPAAQPPYLPAAPDYPHGHHIAYSCRPGGETLFDLLGTLPTHPYGVMLWQVLDREEEIFESDEVRDEYKVMHALWGRYVSVGRKRVEILSDWEKGMRGFVDLYWRFIHRAAGWAALRYWLLLLLSNRFLTGKQVAETLRHYERNIGMQYWDDALKTDAN